MRLSLAAASRPTQAPFTMTGDRDALGIDVRSFLEPPDDRAHVFSEVADRRGFRATAALSVSTLVEADRQHAGLGDCSCQIRQRRHTLDDAVAIADARRGEQNDDGEFGVGRGVCRTRKRRANVETGGRDGDRFVTLVRIDLGTRRG